MQLPYHPNPYRSKLTCSQCGASDRDRFVHPATPSESIFRLLDQPYIAGAPICAECFRESMRAEGQRMHEPEPNIQAWTMEQLKSIGLSEDERQADVGAIPQKVLDAIPDEVLKCMLSGYYPKRGLGLVGVARCGKSSALAALVHALVLQNATNRAPFVALTQVKRVMWMNWPLTCHQWRLNGIHWSVERAIAKASRVKLLVIDDIGRETKRRDSSEDVTIGHLDAIITARDRENLFTLWTSNKSEEELVQRYETPLLGRLLRLNPMTWVEGAEFHPRANMG